MRIQKKRNVSGFLGLRLFETIKPETRNFETGAPTVKTCHGASLQKRALAHETLNQKL